MSKKYYRIIVWCIFLLVLSIGTTSAQDINFEWAKALDRAQGASVGRENYFIGVDANKNVYTAGHFQYTRDFDPGPATFNLTSIGNIHDDIYISKFDASGNFLWAKQFGGKGNDVSHAFAIDDAGNIYCTGVYTDTIDCDPGPDVFNLPFETKEAYSAFISKLDADGNFKWAVKIDAASADFIELDKKGDVFVGGIFYGTEADLDTGPGVYKPGGLAVRHTYIIKLDNNGNYQWAKALTGSKATYINGMAVDKNENIYISGQFEGITDFDPSTANTYNLNSGSIFTFDNYICMLDLNGNFVWAKQRVGGSLIDVDNEGNIITYEHYSGIVTKMDKNCSVLWGNSCGARPYTENDYINNLLYVDSIGNIYTGGSVKVASTGNTDISVSKLSPDGSYIYIKEMGGYFSDIAYGMAVDKSGGVYTIGTFPFSGDFDAGPGTYKLTAPLNTGTFIVKMSPCPNPTYSSLNISACTKYTLNNITYNLPGTYNQVLKNTAGCDSFITLKLKLEKSNTNLYVKACKEYKWNNITYLNSGTYTDTLISSNGCDSILNLQLTIYPTDQTIVQKSICEGQSFHGHSASGTFTDSLFNVNGCDSIITLYLTVTNKKITSLNATICEGETYLGYTTSGHYADTLAAAVGCDSIRIVDLIINPKKYTSKTIVICEGQSAYLNGHYETNAGIYKDTLSTQFGCDSIITYTLIVHPTPQPSLGNDRNICNKEELILNPGTFDSYLWQDNSTQPSFKVTTIGIYYVRVTDANNCSNTDSIQIKKKDSIPNGFLPLNNKVCLGNTLTITVEGYQGYLWNTGETTKKIDIKNPGKYYLQVKDWNNCKGTDSMEVLRSDACIPISIPSAFSPNADGLNDLFRPIITEDVLEYKMEIFNRYGEKIFETTNISLGWDGNFRGTKQNIGAYVYRILYTNTKRGVVTKNGVLTLVR